MVDTADGAIADVLNGFARLLDIEGFGTWSPDGLDDADDGSLPILLHATTGGLYLALYVAIVRTDPEQSVKNVTVQVRTAHDIADRTTGWTVQDRIGRAFHKRQHLVLGQTRVSAIWIASDTALLDEDDSRYVLTQNFRFICNP